MASEKRKKGIIKKAVITATILLGLVGITYTAVPKVKEFVDDTVDKVVDSIRGGEGTEYEMEDLEKVTNITYSEKDRVLTFDENIKARSYNVNVKYDGGEFMLKVNSSVVDIPKIDGLTDGSVLTFEVYAVGDGLNTTISEVSVYEHIVQFASEEIYQFSKTILERFLDSAKSDISQIRVANFNPLALKFEDNYLIMEGVSKTPTGRDVNATLKYDLSRYKGSTDFSDISNYRSVIVHMMNNIDSRYISSSAEYSEQFVNLTDFLIASDAFKEYTDQGYTIETLKHSNSRIMMENDTSSINYTGVYRAVHQSKPSITFKQENKITIESEKEYLNFSEFISDAQEKGDVTHQSREVYDYNLNNHLINTLKVGMEKNNSNNQDQAREQ